MRRGTNSLLFGAHQVFIHPLIVAFCWWKLYGFPFDPRLWLCFIVHDWGYWGKAEMDGETGKWHPCFGAYIVDRILGKNWAVFTLCHSRYVCKMASYSESKLCYADKLAIVYTPRWMYRKDELDEYLSNSTATTYKEWKQILSEKMLNFVKDKDNGFGPMDYTVKCKGV